jgi:mono/diheme cytochrome c family protein
MRQCWSDAMMRRWLWWWIGGLTLGAGVIVLALVFHFASSPEEARSYPPLVVTPEKVAHGAYLARAGDCVVCHTQRGGQPYAGGRVMPTPFGEMVVPNITQDKATGIGLWNADDFWRALHFGKSKDGHMLYPAFPYTNYTKVTRADSDDLFAFFQSIPAVTNPREPHRLRFPYNQAVMLAGWRALYFRPGEYQHNPAQSAQWNRGAYLVNGLGHCNACHTRRNLLGASEIAADLEGGLIPVLNWYAPSLTSDPEQGLGLWSQEEIRDVLKNGLSAKGAAVGPMAEVVMQSLQYLKDDDINSMAVYLKGLPHSGKLGSEGRGGDNAGSEQRGRILAQGAKLYETHCQDCHLKEGKGQPPAYPPLAGNLAITMPSAVNAIRIVLHGGFSPATQNNPRPYGMAPYGAVLTDAEVAAVVSYIRSAWGNAGGGRELVEPNEVNRYREAPVD